MKYDNLTISMGNAATTQHEYVFTMCKVSATAHLSAPLECKPIETNCRKLKNAPKIRQVVWAP